MVDLTPKSACADLLPLTIGTTEITEVSADCVTALMPFTGQAKALGAALKAAHGCDWPAPNRATGSAAARCVWTGMDQAMLLGPAPDAALAAHAAVVDQSDSWAIVRISGPQVSDVLARLVPLDLRRTAFKRGHCARSLVGHMNAVLTRVGDDALQIMVFRSMAHTLVHELAEAATGVLARAADATDG